MHLLTGSRLRDAKMLHMRPLQHCSTPDVVCRYRVWLHINHIFVGGSVRTAPLAHRLTSRQFWVCLASSQTVRLTVCAEVQSRRFAQADRTVHGPGIPTARLATASSPTLAPFWLVGACVQPKWDIFGYSTVAFLGAKPQPSVMRQFEIAGADA